MKRTMTPIILVILFLSVLVVSNAQAEEKCTEAALNGRYGFHLHGFQFGGEELFAAVGIVTFDGAGGGDRNLMTSMHGVIQRGVGRHRYVINPDCTGYIMNEPGSLIQDIVIVDGGNEIRSLAHTPVWAPVWTGLYKKQRVEGCTAANWEGTWGYSLQGSILRDESFRPAAIMGRVTFDGVGRLTGTEGRVVGEEFVTLDVDTTYTVEPDCTLETAGLSYGVLVGDGSETFLIRTIDGWVVTGFPKRQ